MLKNNAKMEPIDFRNVKSSYKKFLKTIKPNYTSIYNKICTNVRQVISAAYGK
jgi:hypothetical protein